MVEITFSHKIQFPKELSRVQWANAGPYDYFDSDLYEYLKHPYSDPDDDVIERRSSLSGFQKRMTRGYLSDGDDLINKEPKSMKHTSYREPKKEEFSSYRYFSAAKRMENRPFTRTGFRIPISVSIRRRNYYKYPPSNPYYFHSIILGQNGNFLF